MSIRALVVDNASGDSPQIAQAIDDHDWSSWVTLARAPKNGGFASGSNLGIARAYDSGAPSYIHLLNPDTLVRPSAVDSLARFLEAQPEVGIASSSFETNEVKDQPFAFRFPSLLSEIARGLDFGFATRLLAPWTTIRHMGNSSEPADWVSGASIMIRRELFAAIGGLDESYYPFLRRLTSVGTHYMAARRVRGRGGPPRRS